MLLFRTLLQTSIVVDCGEVGPLLVCGFYMCGEFSLNVKEQKIQVKTLEKSEILFLKSEFSLSKSDIFTLFFTLLD